ncbi:MAG: CHAP domain-containing protein [Methanobrevibacter sp.]|nr:CHAP domain-containing protein [Methanobrevibacter sp.]
MEKVFVPRKSAPEKTNKYFLRTVKGGYSQCIAGSPESFAGSPLANCVGYAWGRAAELEGDPNCNIGVPKSRINSGKHNPTSAWAWMNYANGRKTGKTPKLGAIAVWKKKGEEYGHVAVVSEIYSDGSWLAEESGYKSYNFRTKKYNKNGYKASNWNFLGFIYLKVDLVPEPTLKVGDKVKILAKGNSRKDGKGKASGGVGWTRYILSVNPGQKYPYQVGSKSRITTGYYTAKALKKV